MADTIAFLVERGIPVMAHVGLTPQSINALGGFRTQGRDPSDWGPIEEDARAVADAGAFAWCWKRWPSRWPRRSPARSRFPTIGIGASAACDGQILVLEDMLGLSPRVPKFVKRYSDLGPAIDRAVAAYAAEVRSRRFPAADNVYDIKPKGDRSLSPVGARTCRNLTRAQGGLNQTRKNVAVLIGLSTCRPAALPRARHIARLAGKLGRGVRRRGGVMSDIFQEVDEAVRREQLEKLWKRYGNFVIAAAVAGRARDRRLARLPVVGSQARPRKAGAAFDAATELADQGKPAEAEAAFARLAADGTAGYRVAGAAARSRGACGARSARPRLRPMMRSPMTPRSAGRCRNSPASGPRCCWSTARRCPR